MWKKIVAVVIVSVVVLKLWSREEPFQEGTLEGKNVIVTGASSGIGEQIAYHYARMGANVFITARREALLKQVLHKCRELGRKDAKFGYLAASMGTDEAAKQVIESAVHVLGSLDYLILNHAYIGDTNFWQHTVENQTILHKNFDVNFFSYVYLTDHAMPHLKRSKGAIGVVSSLVGKTTFPLQISYSAAKFALDGFFGGLRKEQQVAKSGVSITLCVLGMIDTEAVKSIADDWMDKTNIDCTKLMGELADPSDCGYAIIKGTTRRDYELYYPSEQWIWLNVALRHFIIPLSEDMEWLIKYFPKHPIKT